MKQRKCCNEHRIYMIYQNVTKLNKTKNEIHGFHGMQVFNNSIVTPTNISTIV